MFLVRIQTKVFIAPDSCGALFCGAILDPQGDIEKHYMFKPVSRAARIRKVAPKAPQKHKKNTWQLSERQLLRKAILQKLSHQILAFKAPDVNMPTNKYVKTET